MVIHFLQEKSLVLFLSVRSFPDESGAVLMFAQTLPTDVHLLLLGALKVFGLASAMTLDVSQDVTTCVNGC
jgi:hypothetical protein